MYFIDLYSQYQRIAQPVQQAVADILASQHYIMGAEVVELEQRLADYVGVKYAISCSSGTDALVLALMTQQLAPDDVVFVPSFSFFATAESVSLVGARPVFVDSAPIDFNLALPSLKQAYEQVVNDGQLRPRGIIAVDLFGLPADWDALQTFAREHDLFLIEDAAQSFGAVYKGRRAGGLAQLAATSFFPSKPLGCYGDGGAVFTDDETTAELLKSLRIHGQGEHKYDNVRIGLNARLDTIQATILLQKLTIFDSELTMRDQVAATYTEALHDVVQTPQLPQDSRSAWAQYSCLAADSIQREAILAALTARDIPTAVHYRVPIHLQLAYKYLGYQPGSLVACEDLSQRIFSLPMHPYLSAEDITRIATVIKSAI
jgi:dTDP-4-amino-4,6-dideoxygalactose transaminase